MSLILSLSKLYKLTIGSCDRFLRYVVPFLAQLLTVFIFTNTSFTEIALAKETSETQRYLKIREYLNQHQVIRLAVLEENNLGHQAIGASTVRRLRELGFLGQIEIVYQRQALPKLAKLFPPFSLREFESLGWVEEGQAPPILNYHGANLRFIDFDTFVAAKPNEVALGFVGGDDRKLPPEALRVKTLVRVQPFRWQIPPSIARSGRLLQPAFDNYRNLGVVLNHQDEDEAFSVNDIETLRADELLQLKELGFRALKKSREEFDLAVVYGHALSHHPSRLAAYLIALHKAKKRRPELFKGKSVVLIFNNFSSRTIHDLHQILKFYKIDENEIPVTDISDPSFNLQYGKLAQNGILATFVGNVTKQLFESLLGNGDLVPIVEGQNTIHFMALTGRPYLPSWPHRESYHWPLIYDGTDLASETLSNAEMGLQSAYMLNRVEDASEKISEMLIQARIEFSPVNSAFERHKIPKSIESDKVALLVEEVMKRSTLIGWATHACEDIIRTMKYPRL